MNLYDYMQLAAYFIITVGLAYFFGKYMTNIYFGKKTLLHYCFGRIEYSIYKLLNIDAEKEMNWKEYASALILFNIIGFIVLFFILFFQNYLPLNPQKLNGLSWHLAFNTAVSFMTNTNWQSYSGESALSYLSQAVGLTVQNFLSAATGLAVLAALIKGLTRMTAQTIGNFWNDLTKSVLYILLPVSIIIAVTLVSCGVIQNFKPYITAKTLEGAEQIIPMGPAASQVAIKQIGTNGGGFFGVNSAHPFENPTPLSNFIQMFSILFIPFACVFMFGRMLKKTKHGYAIFSAMLTILLIGLSIQLYFEFQSNPVFHLNKAMEGKETRFGIMNSVLWSNITTCASNGSVNSMHDSFSPVAGMIAMLNMMLGEVVFGGVGAGLYGMVMFVILTVFLTGLMVGRTPEYLNKKIEKKEILMSAIAVIAPSAILLFFTAIAVSTFVGTATLNNKGPHGLSEILYAFTSAANNNGSAFAGLGVDNQFYNILLGIAMLIGRFAVIIPVLVIAGSMAAKKNRAESTGTFRTDTTIFVFLLISVILIVGALTFFPALTLGPICEHILLQRGICF